MGLERAHTERSHTTQKHAARTLQCYLETGGADDLIKEIVCQVQLVKKNL